MRVLKTDVTPIQANHSFSGVFSDLTNHGIEDVFVSGLSFGGEIGAYSVYWLEKGSSLNHFRFETNWQLVASGFSEPCPSLSVHFAYPIRVPSRTTAAFYVHSSRQNDRGILYQSFPKGETVGEDDCLVITPGVARLGETPFGGAGWFRQNRGFSGELFYRPEKLLWSFSKHVSFPPHFRNVVFTLLLCWNRDDCLLSYLPYDCLIVVFEQLYWRDFAPQEGEVPEEVGLLGRAKKEWCFRFWLDLYRRFIGYSYHRLLN
jgi:hypothetical protein